MSSETEIINKLMAIASRGSPSDVIAEASKHYSPIFMPMFESLDDAKRFLNKIPYKNRAGTISIILGGIILESGKGGYSVVTGGSMSRQESIELINIIRDRSTNQKGCPIVGL